LTGFDLKPGDRVILHMRHSRRGPASVPATFERMHDPASLLVTMSKPENFAMPNDNWDKALRSGRKLAAFRVINVVGIFQVDDEGRMWDELDREVEIVRRDEM